MKLFSTEQVSKYHPDKYADQISDAILTECLKQDPHSHVACECMVKGTTVVLGGEITTKAKINYKKIVRRVASKLGYKAKKIINLIGKQSPEINHAVVREENIGAGDQGIMFGYATRETKSYLPAGFDLANRIIKAIEDDVENNPLTILKGDAKTQVTWDYDSDCPELVLVSVCHEKGYTREQVKEYVMPLLREVYNHNDLYIINPAGEWTIGGPEADCGLTGRKIVCDQYGGYCPVGGGAFSGKDPSKVDRSGSYMARQIAIDIVKKFHVKWAEVQLAYMIGEPHPVSVKVKTSRGKDEEYENWVLENYDLTPAGIIKHLDLLNWDYEKLAEGCHYFKK